MDRMKILPRKKKTAAPATPKLKPPRIGAVAYLNARPLCHGLGRAVRYGHPVVIAEQLRNHELDVANVPIMECLENPGYDLVDGIGVCSRGPVYSVVLSHKVPLGEIKSIALDSASKTSAALIRVLASKMLRQTIEFLPSEAPSDAHLWIGDQSMAYRKAHPEEDYLDLGAAWQQLTKLPFVFALWAMHPRPDGARIADRLRAKAALGMAARAEIAKTPEEYNYLTKNVRFELGDEEKRGIACFAEYLLEYGLIQSPPKLNWI